MLDLNQYIRISLVESAASRLSPTWRAEIYIRTRKDVLSLALPPRQRPRRRAGRCCRIICPVSPARSTYRRW